jgi:mono/diheme cytochrome c family protein
MSRCFLGLLTLVVALGAVACDDPAPDLAPWTVADHDHQAEVKTARRPERAANYSQPSQRDQLVEVTWQKQCASCHGRRGRGDGPQAAMMKPRDLSKPDWQASVTDEQLAQVIRQGKDKMPAFNLPESMVTSLVAHVRKMVPKSAGVRGEEQDDNPEEGATVPSEPSGGSASPKAPATPPTPATGAGAPNAPAAVPAAPAPAK